MSSSLIRWSEGTYHKHKETAVISWNTPLNCISTSMCCAPRRTTSLNSSIDRTRKLSVKERDCEWQEINNDQQRSNQDNQSPAQRLPAQQAHSGLAWSWCVFKSEIKSTYIEFQAAADLALRRLGRDVRAWASAMNDCALNVLPKVWASFDNPAKVSNTRIIKLVVCEAIKRHQCLQTWMEFFYC